MSAKPRVLFFGMEGALATGALRALRRARLEVGAVILPAPAPAPGGKRPAIVRVDLGGETWPLLPRGGPDSLVDLARRLGLPLFQLASPGDPEALDVLARLAPDIGCVACFDRRLPGAMLQLPAAGILNLHPSPLPRFRGPAPLFWTFRAGLTQTAVTVHLMDEGLDTGPILGQAPVSLPLGCSGAEAERLCAAVGGPLLAEMARRRVAGGVTPAPQPPGPPADPWPRSADFCLDREDSAARAFHFMRGTVHWGRPYVVEGDEGELRLRRAVALLADGEPWPVPAVGEVVVRFREGALVAEVFRSYG